MGLVVQHHMDQVARTVRPDEGHGPQVHQGRPVPVQAPHPPPRPLGRDAQRDGRAVPHGPYRQEIPAVALVPGLPVLVKLPAGLPCGGHHRVLPRRLQNQADGLLPPHGVGVGRDWTTLVVQRPLAHHKRRLPPLGEQGAVLGQPVLHLFPGGVPANDKVRNVQHVQQREGDLPLEDVLGLVVHPRLPPPAHNKQAGDAVYLPVQQGCRRVHDVPQPAVLEVHHRGLARGQMIPRRQRRRVPLVGRDDVMGRVQPVPVQQPGAYRLQLAVRHPGEKFKAPQELQRHCPFTCRFSWVDDTPWVYSGSTTSPPQDPIRSTAFCRTSARGPVRQSVPWTM